MDSCRAANRCGLEPQISLKVLRDLPDEACHWELSTQQLCGLLVVSDLTESHSPWPVPVGFLDTSGCWCTLPAWCLPPCLDGVPHLLSVQPWYLCLPDLVASFRSDLASDGGPWLLPCQPLGLLSPSSDQFLGGLSSSTITNS